MLIMKLQSKQGLVFNWMDALPSHIRPTCSTSLYPRIIVFEISLLALNQVTKEHTTVQVTVAGRIFSLRNKWT